MGKYKTFSLVLGSLLFGGCGTINIEGEIRVVHAVEIDSIEQILDIACGTDVQCKQDIMFAILDDIGSEETP